MVSATDDEDAKRICGDCVGETYLRAEIRRAGEAGFCSYCEAERLTVDLDEFASWIEGAFERHFYRSSTEPESWEYALLADRESTHEFSRQGEPVIDAISYAALVDEDVATDVQAILEERHSDFDSAAAGMETEFDGDSHYAEKPIKDHAWRAEWDYFERSLKTEARYFSRSAAAHLESLFSNLGALKTRDDRPLVVTVGPGQQIATLFRGRVFQSMGPLEEALARPDLKLGPPPSAGATAGRMNAAGISVFYCADREDVVIAEVRPPVGSKVVVAQFEIIRPLRLLDLTALGDVGVDGSIFDPAYARTLERAAFLRTLSRRMTRAVMPDDASLEYLTTQAIADFLATEATDPLDGIVFPSAQVSGSGINVVLFHKAARVALLDLPAGAEVKASSGSWEDGGDDLYWETSYEATEYVPRADAAGIAEDGHVPGDPLDPATLHQLWFEREGDSRQPALRVLPGSLKVHEVTGVAFSRVEHEVRRRRRVRR